MNGLFGRLLGGVLLGCVLLCALPSSSFAESAHADGASAGEHASGPPTSFQSDLALWSAITFLFFLVVLSQVAWKPLNNALEQREAGIRQNIHDAESNRKKAEALLRDYETKLAKAQEEVKGILAEARRDAEHTKQEIIATAQREAEATRQRAVADIERARDGALNDLFEFMSTNVAQATEHVLQRSITGEDQERLIRESLASLNLRRN